MSDKLMRFDPATGARRHASCVGSDVTGLLIVPDGEPIKAAPEPATVAAGAMREMAGAGGFWWLVRDSGGVK